MGNNEEKNRYFIEINSYCTQTSLPRRETARKHNVPELRRWHLKGVNATCHSFNRLTFNRRSRPPSTILKSLLSYLLLIIRFFFALIFFVNIFWFTSVSTSAGPDFCLTQQWDHITIEQSVQSSLFLIKIKVFSGQIRLHHNSSFVFVFF